MPQHHWRHSAVGRGYHRGGRGGGEGEGGTAEEGELRLPTAWGGAPRGSGQAAPVPIVTFHWFKL